MVLYTLSNKFNEKEYTQYDRIIQEGTFDVIDKKYGKVNYDDVFDGTSFNSSKQKDGNDDGHGRDGLTVREEMVEFKHHY